MSKTVNKRCKSPYCVEVDGLKGRIFEAPEDDQTLEGIWCKECVKLYSEIRFFTDQTVAMLRRKYQEMRVEDLPDNIGNLLMAFVRDLLAELGEEL